MCMKKKLIGMCILMCMILLLKIPSRNVLLSMLPEGCIGNLILKYTPVGSSKDEVLRFIERRNFEIHRIHNHHWFPRGITRPENLCLETFPRGRLRYSAQSIGSSHIIVPRIANRPWRWVSCVWIFDESGKLILVDVRKQYIRAF